MESKKLMSLLVSPDTNIKQAMQLLNKTAERILMVVDSEYVLLGTVSDGDIRRSLVNDGEFCTPVSEVMQSNFASIQAFAADREKAAKRMMLQKGINHIPVLDRSGVIVDILTWTDFLNEEEADKAPCNLRDNMVVIMAGGKGTRLYPFTQVLPKPLIPVGEQTIIDFIMERFFKFGFHRFLYTLNFKKEFIKLYLSENNYPSQYDIQWIEETEFLGTAGGLSLLKPHLTDSFFVTNCDSIMEVDFDEILAWHLEQNATITIVGCHAEINVPFGVLDTKNGLLTKMNEKPTYDFIVNTGVYVIEPEALDYLKPGEPMDMNVLITAVQREKKVTVFPVYERWSDIGQWKEYWKSIKKLGGESV